MGTGTSKAGAGEKGNYKKFDGVAEEDVGMSYAGGESASDAVAEYFDSISNYKKLIDAMSDQEMMSFQNWTEGGFMNGHQWAGFGKMTPYEQRDTRVFDKYIDQAVLKEGVELARLSDAQLLFGKGKKTATLAQIQKLQGQEISAKGNMSFSAAAEGLEIGSVPPIQYKLKIPKGTKGAAMWIGDERVNENWGAMQREVITNRDIVMKIGKARKKKLSNGREVIEVDLLYQRRMPHDYGG